ncbi:MAG TPA: TRAM domain-containing protein, partial [Candidatus Acetothermia bacterium]|nr:TRAM domain-containing protein [Candidatus Acetothermia bacterium]
KVGEVEEVLVEGFMPSKGLFFGKTRDMRTVLLPGEESLVGEFVWVKLERATPGAIYGTPVREPVA